MSARALIVATGMAALLWAGVQYASAQSIGACSVSTTPVSFGSYNPFAPAPLDGQGTVQYSCFGLIRTLRISISQGGGGTYNRRMSGPAGPLYYNLYLDGTRQTVWGDGSGGSQPLIHGNILIYVNYTATVYGRIPPLQNVGVGTYTDAPVVTLEF